MTRIILRRAPELAQRLVDLLAPVPVALDKEARALTMAHGGC